MKRRWLWLLLPIALCALVWGARWRADHPTPTKQDLEIRALMSQASRIQVIHSPRNRTELKYYRIKISKEELQPFVDSFCLSPQPVIVIKRNMIGANGIFGVHCQFDRPEKDGITVVFGGVDIDNQEGRLVIFYSDTKNEKNLHPATIKRWTHLLFSHPRIGPELKARLKR